MNRKDERTYNSNEILPVDPYTGSQSFDRGNASPQNRNEFDVDNTTLRPSDSRFSPYQTGYRGEPFYNSSRARSDYYYDQGQNRYGVRSGSRESPLQYEELGGYQDSGARRETSFRGKGPKNYRRSDDRIKEDVCDRLSDEHDIDASDITVDVKDGEVELSGKVDNRGSKRHAEDCCLQISGVNDVMNKLRVNSSNVHKLSERSESKDGNIKSGKRKASK